MSDSETWTDEDERTPTSGDRSGNRGQRSNDSSKGTLSVDKKMKYQYAVAKIEYTAVTPDQLSLCEGDLIGSIKQKRNSNLWEGENLRTSQKGIFHACNVEFHTKRPQAQRKCDVPYTSTSHRTQKQGTQPKQNQTNVCQVVLSIILVAAAVAVYYRNEIYSSQTSNPVNITLLKEMFKAQDPDMWDTLRAGLLPSKTEAVKTFLFVHAKNGRTAECLIKKLSDNYCEVYRASDMNFDEGYVSKVKERLQIRKCVVIYDLENLSEDGITLLKGFCDAYTPIVPHAKFYFALDIDDLPISADAYKTARHKLETIWSTKYSYDEFGGTLTRLTQNVLRVIGEDELPC